jgi:exodeoxyribonuclease-3|tara:strand:- start:1248 stop:2021 length:774 start_codon:yes stop_codon:yes gene_type:complete
MIICSWNINSIRVREELLIKLIDMLKPDVVFLQEIKCQNNEFPDQFRNYKLVINGEKGRHGVAILIKKSISFKELNFDSDILNYQARICGINIKNNLNINLINVYCPNGNPLENKEKFDFKIRWLDELIVVIKNLIKERKNVILAGDFNVLDDTRDVQDFENWRNDALGNHISRQKFRELLFSGLTNIVRLYHKPGKKYSFWDYQKSSWERNYGLLIDHFLVSPGISQITETIQFEKEFRSKIKPSDHIPLWIKITT